MDYRRQFVVEDVFEVARLGLILAPGVTAREWLHYRGLPMRLVRPDGGEVRAVGLIGLARGEAGRTQRPYPVILPPGIDRAAVPIGTAVLSPVEGPAVTIEDYERLGAEGYFDLGCDRYFELIRGTIRSHMPNPPYHEELVDRLMQWSLRDRGHDRIRIRTRSSLAIPGCDSVALPDIAWLKEGDYSRRWPRADEALLLIDVDEGRSRADLRDRATLFAEAKVAEYWVVRARRGEVVSHRSPVSQSYAVVESHSGADSVTPLLGPGRALSLTWLLSR